MAAGEKLGMVAQELGQKRPDPCGPSFSEERDGQHGNHIPVPCICLLLASPSRACPHSRSSALPHPSLVARPVGMTAARKEQDLEAGRWFCDLPVGVNVMTLRLNVAAVMGI